MTHSQIVIDRARARLEHESSRLLVSASIGVAAEAMVRIAAGDAGIRYVLALDYLKNFELRDGQVLGARNGQTLIAVTRPYEDAPGHTGTALQATDPLPDASSPNRTAEASHHLPQGHCANTPVVRRQPNPARSGAAILPGNAMTRAANLLQTIKVRDGRAIGDLKWHELVKLAETNEREARILRYLDSHIANAPSHAAVSDLVSEKTMAAAVAHADGASNER
jgi:hypothetical protein